MRTRLDVAGLVIGCVLLALGPLVLTLLRSEDYKSTTVIALSPDNPSAAVLPRALELVSGPVTVRGIQKDVAKDVGWFDSAVDLPNYVTVTQRGSGGDREFVVTARGPGAEEAHELAFVVSATMNGAAEEAAKFVQARQLQIINQKLRRGDPSAAERAELLRRRRLVSDSIDTGASVFALHPTEPTLPQERLGDRIVDALPGSRQSRPNPWWAAVAGLALAAALAFWAILLGSGPRRGGEPSPG